MVTVLASDASTTKVIYFSCKEDPMRDHRFSNATPQISYKGCIIQQIGPESWVTVITKVHTTFREAKKFINQISGNNPHGRLGKAKTANPIELFNETSGDLS